MHPFHLLALLSSTAVAATEFDYIIVGAGTCGLLLANRLSADPSITVALIDPGPDQRANPNVTDPALWFNLAVTDVNWAYQSVPQESADDKVLTMSAGRGIGGTSLINGMTYIRGDKAQFDAWADVGAEGWDWESMYKYMKDVEQFTPPKDWQTDAGASYNPDFHGYEGDLHVAFTPGLPNGSYFYDAEESWVKLGQPLNQDPNGGSVKGFDVWPQTLDYEQNKRWDSATAFYWDVKGRENLKLFNGTAQKLVWSDEGAEPHARGVIYLTNNNETSTLHAKKEVILSAGSLRTPLILEASGVGHPDLLADLGIETVVDLPGVGENLLDQPNNSILYTSNNTSINGIAPYAAFLTAADVYGADVQDEAAAVKGKLPEWAQKIANASNERVSAENIEELLRIQHKLLFDDGVTIGELLISGSGNIYFSAFWVLMPFSRGSVHLCAKDSPLPCIDPKFFLIQHDLNLQARLGQTAATFFGTPPMSSAITSPIFSLPANSSIPEWEDFAVGSLTSNSHALGTASMMRRDLGGVVDPKLRVYGTKGLRVVDASVLPMQMSGHLTATLYAVAERAAGMILKDRSCTRRRAD